MIGVGIDAGLLLRSLHSSLTAVGRDRKIRTTLAVESPTLPPPIARPDETFRPDRAESMNPVGSGPIMEIAPGVRFECLVGNHNRAHRLTTGLASFSGGAILPYHTHPFSESITLLRGTAVLGVEGRFYTLFALDNVVIPPGVPHTVQNQSPHEHAVIHVAMASDTPSRTLVDRDYSRHTMPTSFSGVPGAERVNRFATAAAWHGRSKHRVHRPLQ